MYLCLCSHCSYVVRLFNVLASVCVFSEAMCQYSMAHVVNVIA